MKTSYIALGIGVTALIAAAILAFVMTTKDEPQKASPPALSLSEDRLNRLEAELQKVQEQNEKLLSENEALKKENEIIGTNLTNAATTPTVKVASTQTTESGQNPAPTDPVNLPENPNPPAKGLRVPGPDPTKNINPQDIVLTEDQRHVLDLPMLARVTEYDKRVGLLAFNAGKQENVAKGQRYSIRRDTFLVCTIRVRDVEDHLAVADIVSGSMTLGMQANVGDEVCAMESTGYVSPQGRMGSTPDFTPSEGSARAIPTPRQLSPDSVAPPDQPTPIGPAPTVTSRPTGAPPPPPPMPTPR